MSRSTAGPAACGTRVAYTELLCGLHPVGTPRLCADRLAATSERTGISRFALLVEGSGDLAATEENVRRLGAEVLPHLRSNSPAGQEACRPVSRSTPPAYGAASDRRHVSSPGIPGTG